MNIIQRTSPNRSGTLHPRAIMLHHTASVNFASTVSYLQRPTSRVSAHFVVGKGGEVAQLVPLSSKAWHAGLGAGVGPIPKNGGNTYAIGIEIVNRGDGKDPFPKAQLEALDDLIAYLDKTLGKALPIYDHKAYAPGRKIDMRANFPLAKYQQQRAYTVQPAKYTLSRKLYLRPVVRIRGSNVRELQKELTRRKFGGMTINGTFGPSTDKAVRAFQRSKGLRADGIVGPATARALGWKWV